MILSSISGQKTRLNNNTQGGDKKEREKNREDHQLTKENKEMRRKNMSKRGKGEKIVKET